jgi:DNA-binding NarL/FixJ family response regulator
MHDDPESPLPNPAPPGTSRLRVLVVDDHPLFRRGLGHLLGDHGFELVGALERGEDAPAAVREHRPEVVLMDTRMPGLSGPEATRLVLAVAPATRVVMLSAAAGETDVRDALAAGACGYLLKSSGGPVIAEAVREAARGHAPFSPAAASVLVDHLRATSAEPAPPDPRAESLSDRERDILTLLAAGEDNQAIGDALYISPLTVKGHVSAILGKLGLVNRVQAAVFAARNGLM